jgi:hypothetical protein
VEGMISLPSMCPDLLGISGCAGGLRGLRWSLAPNLSADARGWSSGRRFAWDMRGLLGGYCAGTWWADAWMPACAVEAVEKGGCTVKSGVNAYIEALYSSRD